MATEVLSPGQIPEAPEPTGPQEWHENLNVHMVCPECQEFPPNLVENFSAGDTICGSCGLVLGDRLVDTRSEWRTFANDETGTDDPSRVGNAADPLLNGSQLETQISFGDGGARSRELHRTHARMITDKSTKNLKEAYAQIAAIAAPMHLSDDTVKTAQATYKQLEENKGYKGKNLQTTIAGCIFVASRRTKATRSFKEITQYTGVSKKDIGREFKKIEAVYKEEKKKQVREAAARGANTLVDDSSSLSTDPVAICVRNCDLLRLPRVTSRVAEDLCRKLSEQGVGAGRSPLTTAAAAVYFASYLMGTPKTAKEIAPVAQVSDGTIRTAYKFIHAEKDKLIDAKWISDGGDVSRLPSG